MLKGWLLKLTDWPEQNVELMAVLLGAAGFDYEITDEGVILSTKPGVNPLHTEKIIKYLQERKKKDVQVEEIHE